MKATIDSISRKQIQGKFGLTDIVTIQVNNKQTYISGFDNKGETKDWKAGDQVDLTITKRFYTDKQGQQREGYNFRLPSRLDQLEVRVAKLEQQVSFPPSPEIPPPNESPSEKEDFDMSEIPF